MIKVSWLFCAMLLLASVQAAIAASRLGPPIEALLADPEHTRIVVAEAVKKTENTRILFSVKQRLSGEAPDEILLRTDAETFADVVAGRSYVVAWTRLIKNRRSLKGWEEDPDGPSTVQIMGLGSTALFEDTAQISLLFSPAPDGEIEKQLDALLVQMQRDDFRSRGLVIMELFLRSDLTEIMTTAQADMLRTVLQAQTLDPQQQDFILQTALRLPRDMTSPWLGEAFRKIIIQNGTQYDLSSFVPGLVRTAAEGLQQTGGRSDLELLGILFYSNNPGVAKAALAAMDHLGATATAVKVQEALGRDWLHTETRRALQRYLDQSGQQSAMDSHDST
jgi:hypothetical protein